MYNIKQGNNETGMKMVSHKDSTIALGMKFQSDRLGRKWNDSDRATVLNIKYKTASQTMEIAIHGKLK